MPHQLHVYDISEQGHPDWPSNPPWWNPDYTVEDQKFWNSDGFGWLYLEVDGMKLKQPVNIASAREWVKANLPSKGRYLLLLDEMEKNPKLYLRRKST